MEYVLLNGHTLPCSNDDQVEDIQQRMIELGVESLPVFRTEMIQEFEDGGCYLSHEQTLTNIEVEL